jgi:hypothetical protein
VTSSLVEGCKRLLNDSLLCCLSLPEVILFVLDVEVFGAGRWKKMAAPKAGQGEREASMQERRRTPNITNTTPSTKSALGLQKGKKGRCALALSLAFFWRL